MLPPVALSSGAMLVIISLPSCVQLVAVVGGYQPPTGENGVEDGDAVRLLARDPGDDLDGSKRLRRRIEGIGDVAGQPPSLHVPTLQRQRVEMVDFEGHSAQ